MFHCLNKRVVPLDLLTRYSFNGDKSQLYKRVVDYIDPKDYKNDILKIIMDEKFLPAGNTLVAGSQKLSPNCAIIGEITNQNVNDKKDLFIKLLSSAIGVGLDLSKTNDPVKILKDFSREAKNISLKWDRPLRGNMATLDITHDKITEFISCKNNLNKDLTIFNISVKIGDLYMNDVINNKNSEIFDTLCSSAHRTGDPGVIFIDKAQTEYSKYEGPIVTSVPCGEQFMFEGETCTLGAINLDKFYDNGFFDIDDYIKTIHLAVNFLDNTIDKLVIPDNNMNEKIRSLRRIGLGVMGFSTLLQKMNISYESYEALELSSLLSYCLTEEAINESKKLGIKYSSHKYSKDRRNISVTCLQPTGGIRRLVCDDGFSIEPLFSEAIKISPSFSVKMTSTWQKNIENAVSKTINLPNSATIEDVKNIYKESYILGCKGITIYRDGCRANQPIKCDGDLCVIE